MCAAPINLHYKAGVAHFDIGFQPKGMHNSRI